MSMTNRVELSNKEYITNQSSEKLTNQEIIDTVNNYLKGNDLKRLQLYDEYYQVKNTAITRKVKDKEYRGKTPNNYVPTAYYSTIIDTLAGYMFSDVQYLTESEDFKNVIKDNNAMIKDMNAGLRALAYNKSVEIVYSVGDGKGPFEIKFSPVDPRQMILIFNQDIEPKIYCGIRIILSPDENYDYKLDVIYKDEWSEFYLKDDYLVLKDVRPLFFNECPVVVYMSDDMAVQSPFEKIIPYINALDFLITGNANDIDKLTDSILVLSKILKDEDLKHLDELKVIMGADREDINEYIEKNMDPSFREYASKLIIQEIHKHSHVIDWYSPDSGLSGEISAKAMKTRLFDMDMYSNRLEMVFRIGAEKRKRLVNHLLSIRGLQPAEDLEIVFNRTLPDDFLENLVALNNVTFISDLSKFELLNLDPEKELSRIEEQKTANMEMVELNMSIDEDEEIENA